MKVQDILAPLALEVAAGAEGLDREITGGYASDLMSWVIVRAKEGNVWVTVQAHPNVVAVANLLDLACVIITEGARPDEQALSRASEKDIPVLLSKKTTFTVVGKLAKLGVGEG
jgi:predicted transcriptional regulator